MLKTNRLIIDAFTSDDFASAVGALKHPSMQTEIEAAGAISASDLAQRYLYPRSLPESVWAIRDQVTQQLAGVLETFMPSEEFQYSELAGSKSVCRGTWIAPECWKKGFAKEAWTAVISYLFLNDPDLVFIQSSSFETNVPAVALQRSLGLYPLKPRIFHGQVDLPFVMHRDHLNFNYDRYLSPERSKAGYGYSSAERRPQA